ncbi:MOSC domain-containing protein [Planoprotostelium fungivorum]|uniref:MOSC domain-containing protein n=1 Tax=Planoprotostelium fungivorum TaxID=1890364 RepID=A0A2P6NNU0_9EUKA|nr:MOSC domain-containing protein [Planoprotostelium fungivorum]
MEGTRHLLPYVASAIAILSASFVYYRFLQSKGTKTSYRVKDLFIYPIKSCGGIRVEKHQVGPYGLLNDRRWMVVSNENNFITLRYNHQPFDPNLILRQCPNMALIAPSLTPTHLHLESPGERSEGPLKTVTIWGGENDAVDEGEAAAEWFTKVLGRSARLVRQRDDHDRVTPSHHVDGLSNLVSFADGFPLLLTSTSGLALLNEKITGKGGVSLPMSRFRPNIVIDGVGVGFVEDVWSRITIGGVRFSVVKPCARCKATTVDSLTGKFDGPEPLETLKTFRTMKGLEGVYFGQNLTQENEGTVSVGDAVYVLKHTVPTK